MNSGGYVMRCMALLGMVVSLCLCSEYKNDERVFDCIYPESEASQLVKKSMHVWYELQQWIAGDLHAYEGAVQLLLSVCAVLYSCELHTQTFRSRDLFFYLAHICKHITKEVADVPRNEYKKAMQIKTMCAQLMVLLEHHDKPITPF